MQRRSFHWATAPSGIGILYNMLAADISHFLKALTLMSEKGSFFFFLGSLISYFMLSWRWIHFSCSACLLFLDACLGGFGLGCALMIGFWWVDILLIIRFLFFVFRFLLPCVCLFLAWFVCLGYTNLHSLPYVIVSCICTCIFFNRDEFAIVQISLA